MPSTKKSHEEFRLLVCGICWRKPKDLQTITPVVLDLIRRFCWSEYELEDKALPLAACKSCVKALKVIEQVTKNKHNNIYKIQFF